eukprot:GHRQ01011718.1.p1 GENE.GHRQ01011718.1~~GHRQ01011718.1.p1  ORF type:complete len:281 (+),score=86.17 GHRQ01011718.1:216-1058(+)
MLPRLLRSINCCLQTHVLPGRQHLCTGTRQPCHTYRYRHHWNYSAQRSVCTCICRICATENVSFTMEKVSFGSSGAVGYEAGPKDSPAVVVLQEWWGVNDIIKEHAHLIADAGGFRVLIPDLYKGKVGVDKEEASHLMNNLDFKAAVAELTDAVVYLRSTGSPKVGVVGFCMGGALTFAAAQHAGVDCAAPFYGIPDPAICDPAAIKVPVQAHFGELDTMKGFSDPASIQKVVDSMKAAGAPVELFMYEKSGHAFMNALTEKGRAKIKGGIRCSGPRQGL